MTFQEKIHTLRVAGFCFERLWSDIDMQMTFMKEEVLILTDPEKQEVQCAGHKGSSRVHQGKGRRWSYGQAPVVVYMGRDT